MGVRPARPPLLQNRVRLSVVSGSSPQNSGSRPGSEPRMFPASVPPSRLRRNSETDDRPIETRHRTEVVELRRSSFLRVLTSVQLRQPPAAGIAAAVPGRLAHPSQETSSEDVQAGSQHRGKKTRSRLKVAVRFASSSQLFKKTRLENAGLPRKCTECWCRCLAKTHLR
jgi:hypothetical protein